MKKRFSPESNPSEKRLNCMLASLKIPSLKLIFPPRAIVLYVCFESIPAIVASSKTIDSVGKPYQL